MSAFPKNPFKPGAGRIPAHTDHRPEDEGILSSFLQTLDNDQPNLKFGFLYGPRGNGKTALLRWLHVEAAAAGTPAVRLVPEPSESPTKRARANRRLTDAALDEFVAYEGGADRRSFLIAKGCVWQDSPASRSPTPGIPRLTDDMLARIPAG